MAKRKSPCYCINLRRAASSITALYDEILAPTGLSTTQFSLLGGLQSLGESTITQLADHVGLERTTLTRTLRPLMEQGLVQDLSVPGARNRILSLTELGQQTLKQGLPLWRQAQTEVEQRLGKEWVKWLYELADKI
ncbi:MAG: winged helix-turn-helix transcriptional regulator [Lachnospiraceae bacterium]|nr:winged helix-turn-helix transcriptional regulator [Lachnospiraceae bacterium]